MVRFREIAGRCGPLVPVMVSTALVGGLTTTGGVPDPPPPQAPTPRTTSAARTSSPACFDLFLAPRNKPAKAAANTKGKLLNIGPLRPALAVVATETVT